MTFFDYFSLTFTGTVYISKLNSEQLTVSGKGSGTVLTNSIGIPNPLEKLSIEDGATVQIEYNLNIDQLLWSETTEDEISKLIIADNSKVSITKLGDEHKGVSCNIEIEDGATLSGGDLLIAGASPKLDLSGTLDVNTLTIHNHGILNVLQSANLEVSTLTLKAWSFTDMQIDTKVSLDNFILGYEAEIKFHHSAIVFDLAEKFEMESGSKLTLLGTNKEVDITAADVVIHDSASIDVSEGGDTEGQGVGSSSVGASHGGEGGGNTGPTYGSTSLPVARGSGTTLVQGGGIVSITTNTATIDGSIVSNGKSGSSGGSIYISATVSVEGHGDISASGGDGGANGGGGGRIAIETGLFSNFHGKFVSYGGSGTSQPGAAGTVYQEYTQSGNTIKNLVVDNINMETNSVTRVSDVNDITELHIIGKSKVMFDSSLANPVIIRKIIGDYSGVLTLEPSQRMEIATVYGTVSPYALECKLVVPATAYAKLPSKLLLKDEDVGSDWNNLEVSGEISGLKELVVATGGRAIINSASQTGSEPVGTFSISKLDVTTDGKLFLATDTEDQYTLKVVDELNVKYGGILTGRNMFITQTPNLQVAYNGLLNVNDGSEAGGEGNGVGGSGGCHGGAGGASSAGAEQSTKYIGGLHAATEAGSLGGDFDGKKGGFGGGILKITEITTLTLNGKISADGKAGSGGAGGGSGGAIFLTDIQDVTGSGSLSVKGGDSDSGGGGGGGRIRFDVKGTMKFEGSYKLQGGSSTTGGAGGSGTASVEYKQTGVIGTILDVHVDNSDTAGAEDAVSGKTYIDIPGEDLSSVDNLNIGDNTIVHIVTEGLHFEAKTLTCGEGSTVVIDDDVIFSADTEEVYSVLFCSFDLYTNGEVRFPASIELKGEDNQLKGRNILRLSFQFSVIEPRHEKTCLRVCDQGRLRPACAATEAS